MNAKRLLTPYKDIPGSYDVVTTEGKAVAERYHFDPWGNRKNPDNWDTADTRTAFLFDRGFTGHEHLDVFKIINMNARLYDPVLGRFFSPDPYVQAPESAQGFNRYSYCANNPLTYTDPSGMLYGNFYDWNGNYIGWDGYEDDQAHFVSDRQSIKIIRKNEKAAIATATNDVLIDVTTTKSVIQEIIGVSERTTSNGNTREEATFLTITGKRYTAQGPDIRTLSWNQTADVIINGISEDIDVSIHSHLSILRTDPDGSGDIKASSALRASTADKSINSNLNIITGPLGDPTWVGTPQGRGFWSTPKNGAAFFDRAWKLKGSISISGLRKILNR